ncbi:MAG TPA: creatininase family protein [Conexibacter sp.]|nr:creatininase family protein [Conexibacter sp.]
MTEPRTWADMTAPAIGEAAARGDVVLLPVGAVEQHGPHLPVDTDIRLAVAVAEEVAKRQPRTLVAPPVWWGLSGYHRGFPGFLTLRPATFMALLEDLCNSILDQGFGKLVLVVGHASNKPIAQLVVSELMQTRGVPVMQVNYLNLGAPAFARARRSALGGDFHAGELETALMLHVRPDLVQMERAVSRPLDPREHLGHSAATRDIFSAGDVGVGFDLRAGFPEGVAGDATLATAVLGADVFEAIAARACEVVDEYLSMSRR